jgi:hypothetical protein
MTCQLSRSIVAVSLAIACTFGGAREAVSAVPDTLSSSGVLTVDWVSIDSLQMRLPDFVQVYFGRSDTPALNAWHVRISQPGRSVPVSIEESADKATRRETVSHFAERLGACVAVNGGYFTMDRTPAISYGLLVVESEVRGPATISEERDGIPYMIARGTLGFTDTGVPEIVWGSSIGNDLFRWPRPPANQPGQPAPVDRSLQPEPWSVREAMGVGPMIARAGAPYVTSDEEVFFGTSIPERHPRTAVGVTEEGDLILMVVDGRQDASIGVTLDELADLMLDVGAEDALNLDGGGSSAIVVDGVLLNTPSARGEERAVHNAVVAFCE